MRKTGNTLLKPLYVRIIYDDLNLDLSPSIIGYEKCGSNKPTIKANKSCYVLHFVLSGSGFIEINGKTIEVSENESFLICPNKEITYYPNKSNPWVYFWIELNGTAVKSLCQDLLFENKPTIKIKDMTGIKNCMLKIFNEELYASDSYSETLRIESLLYKIFSFMFDEFKGKKKQVIGTTSDEKARAIINFMNNNYTDPDLTIEKIAESFFFNPSYVSRLIKSVTGLSPRKYIIRLRMRQAVEMIKNGSFTISQIAEIVGYKNQFYFSKEFKDFYGVTPSKYLEMNPEII